MTAFSKVVFPVAGLGSRILPATKAVPKELLTVVDKPLIQYASDEAVEAGANALVFITSKRKHAIFEHFDRVPELEGKLTGKGRETTLDQVRNTAPDHVGRLYVPQPEALGLGHAVLCARDAVGSDASFGIILPDDLIRTSGPGCMAQMAKLHADTGCSVIAVQEVPMDQVSRYGVVAASPRDDTTGEVSAIVEKPSPDQAPSNLAVVGRYILSNRIFELLKETEVGTDGEIQLTDAIARLIQEETVLCYRFQGQRYDCGDKFGYFQAVVECALRHPEIGADCRRFLTDLDLSD